MSRARCMKKALSARRGVPRETERQPAGGRCRQGRQGGRPTTGRAIPSSASTMDCNPGGWQAARARRSDAVEQAVSRRLQGHSVDAWTSEVQTSNAVEQAGSGRRPFARPAVQPIPSLPPSCPGRSLMAWCPSRREVGRVTGPWERQPDPSSDGGTASAGGPPDGPGSCKSLKRAFSTTRRTQNQRVAARTL